MFILKIFESYRKQHVELTMDLFKLSRVVKIFQENLSNFDSIIDKKTTHII